MTYYDRVLEAANAVRKITGSATPEIALVLGSGLGGFASTLEDARSIRYSELPHWPQSSVIGHEGRVVVGTVGGKRLVTLSGRCHAYEGHPLATVTFATRVLGVLGVKTFILTNAAGGINTSLSQGALMVIDDHINLTGDNPLVGANDERFGVRFPDMTEVYSLRLRQLADAAAAALGVPLSHGIYAGLLGPSYETPAEIRYLRAIGGDAVGMSTVAEAIVARHMGMEVLGLSCITNMAAGILPQPLDHNEVMETAHRVRGRFVALLGAILDRL